jgi:hypothetical protein
MPSSILRVYLWPLTEWKTTANCLASCDQDPPGEDNSYCGKIQSCEGMPVVPGSQFNIIKIQLPSDMPSGRKKSFCKVIEKVSDSWILRIFQFVLLLGSSKQKVF